MQVNEATCPPTLTMPVAVANREFGLNERAWSNPIMEPGWLTPRPAPKPPRSHSGAGPRHSRTALQTAAVAPTTDNAIHERARGNLPTSWPSTGPQQMNDSVRIDSRAPAVAASSRCATTRKGKPHSRANAIAGNCVAKCVHRPSRVPGSDQVRLNERPSARTDDAGWTGRSGGSRSRSRATAADRRPAAAATRNDVDQPPVRSRNTIDTAEAI